MDETAKRVDNVTHNMNFEGRINKVGIPITIARTANIIDPSNKYIVYFILLRNAADNGPDSGKVPESSSI